MKIFLFLIGLVAATIVGYSFEPKMRYQLTGKLPENKPAYGEVAEDVPPEVDVIPADVTPPPAEPVSMPEEPVAAPVEQPTSVPDPTPVTEQPVAPGPVPTSPTEEEPPAPASEPTAPAGTSDVVAVMKASINAGEIREFTFDQVLEWQPGEAPETVDGEIYQSGVASYKAETVFGVKTIQAKALIKDGKVVRWLWPKSGMEIK
jgi:hypothetical protein